MKDQLNLIASIVMMLVITTVQAQNRLMDEQRQRFDQNIREANSLMKVPVFVEQVKPEPFVFKSRPLPFPIHDVSVSGYDHAGPSMRFIHLRVTPARTFTPINFERIIMRSAGIR